MTAAPRQAPAPASALDPGPDLAALPVAFRRETEADIPFLRRLYREMRWDELKDLLDWDDATRVAFLDQQFDAQRMHYGKAYADADFLVVERAGEPVGRLYLYRGHPEDIRIVDIGLLAAARNGGLGTALLRRIQEAGRMTGRSVSIHVEVFNPARRLYDRLGFVEEGEHGPYRLMRWRP